MARTRLEAAPADVEVATRDERVVWRGLPGWDYGQPAQPVMAGNHHEHEDVEDDHEHAADHHEHVPLCTSREDVRAMLEVSLPAGAPGQPVVLAEAGDSLVVDPRPEPPLAFPLHRGLTLRSGRIVLIQDSRPGLSTRRPEPMIAQTRRAPSVRRQQDAPL